MFFLILTPISGKQSVNSVIWSDNFDDGDLAGWRAEGYYAPMNEAWSYSTTGDISNINNVLRLSGDVKFRNGTFAIHESSVAYGSWSFDLDIKSIFGSSNNTHVYFIDGRPYDASHPFDSLCCYDIAASSSQWSPSLGEVPEYANESYDLSPAFFLVKRPNVQIMGYYQADNIDGWSHIDVTRNKTGHFKVYINGTLRIEAKNNDYLVSKSFWLTGETGTFAGLDNIVVRDDIIDPTVEVSNSSSTSSSLTETNTSKSSDDGLPLSNNMIFSTFIAMTLLIGKRRKRKGIDRTSRYV